MSTEEKFVWTEDLTAIFVDQCCQHKDLLQSQRKTLWREVIEHFEKLGHTVTAADLVTKWGNIKVTYGRIIKNNQRSRTKWPYLQQMDEIAAEVYIDFSNINSQVSKSGRANELPRKRLSEGVIAAKSAKIAKNLEDFNWTDKSTSFLLQEYLVRLSEFKDPNSKRKLLWDEIQEAFEGVGWMITSDLLDRKFRSLKNTYLQLKTNDEEAHYWQYFKTFEKICGKNSHQSPEEEIVFIKAENAFYDEDDDNSDTGGYVEAELGDEQPKTEDYQAERLKIEKKKLKELEKINKNMTEHNSIMKEMLEVIKEKLLS